jgi:PAS domain S-box-containing protein
LGKGEKPEDFLGKSVFSFVHPDSKQLIEKKISKVLTQGGFFPDVEEKFIGLDGKEIICKVSATILKSKEGEPFSMVIIRDITAEKEKNEALMESEVKYRAITENSPDVIIRFDKNYKHLYINKAWEKQTGIPVEKALYKTHEELGFPQEMCDFWHKQIKKVFDTGKPHIVEFDLDSPNGIVNIEWRLFPEFSKNGKVITVISISRDISSRKKVEEQLKKSEENYRKIFNSTNEAIVVHDIDTGKIVDINNAGCKMYGYERGELLNQGVERISIFEEGYSEENAFELIEKASKGEPQIFEWRAKRKDGTVFWAEVGLKVATLGDNKRVIAVVRNIDERKKIEERLKTIEKMEALGRLVGGIAHDFNNILTVINGNASMGLKQVKPEDKSYQMLTTILKSGKKAEKLIAKLLAFSRKQIFEPKTISINKIINDMKGMVRSLISEDIKIETNLCEDIPFVKADPGQIERILINLIVNARDAIIENKKQKEKIIEISTEKTIIDDVFVENHIGSVKGEYILVTVKDTGKGIEKEIKDRIFDPFFTTKEEGKGTGLGLSMVYGIVKQNKGYIDVYSEPDTGTIFKIYWPVSEGEQESYEEKKKQSDFKGGEETILIVEDNKDIRDFSKTFLESIGYRVFEAENGKEGLEIFKELQNEIDMVFTDVVMPGIGGKELIEKIKKIKPQIKTLFTSGYPRNQFSETGSLEDNTPFLQKPYSPQNLAKKIREILNN